MSKFQVRVVWGFLGGLALVVLAGILADFWLLSTARDASNTISWSMAVWGYRNPGLVYFLGIGTGAAFIGLPVHFWLGQPTPELWDDYQKAKADVDELEGQLFEAKEAHAVECNRLNYALSDCLAGQRNEHGYPPGLPRLAPGTYPES